MWFTSLTRPELPKLEDHGLKSAQIHVLFGLHNVFEEFELVASIKKKKNLEMAHNKNLDFWLLLTNWKLWLLGQHSRMVSISWGCIMTDPFRSAMSLLLWHGPNHLSVLDLASSHSLAHLSVSPNCSNMQPQNHTLSPWRTRPLSSPPHFLGAYTVQFT